MVSLQMVKCEWLLSFALSVCAVTWNAISAVVRWHHSLSNIIVRKQVTMFRPFKDAKDGHGFL
jgi:hypothetical protein